MPASSDGWRASGHEVSRPSRGPETGHEASNSAGGNRNPCSHRGFVSAPGGTRTPNLLIRRSPSRVHGRPQPSTHAGTEGFRFHPCPQTSTDVHSEWLPTWLPMPPAPVASWNRAARPRSLRTGFGVDQRCSIRGAENSQSQRPFSRRETNGQAGPRFPIALAYPSAGMMFALVLFQATVAIMILLRGNLVAPPYTLTTSRREHSTG